MDRDAFSQLHPAVNFFYFIGALGFGMVFQHPAYVAAGILGAACYYLLLKGAKGLRTLLAFLPICAMISLLNPLVNLQGETVLFYLFGRPYTFEALIYGVVLAGILLVMLLWFGCYSVVMTGDKFTSLFGNLIPSLSLLLVMILRLVPSLMRKAKQISSVRAAIGKGTSAQDKYMDKARSGMTLLTVLASWTLESSVVTADSMRARGYGSTKRSSFSVYRFCRRDLFSGILMLIPAAAILIYAILGAAEATFMPQWYIAPLAGRFAPGFAAYLFYLFLPSLLHLAESLQWRILRASL